MNDLLRYRLNRPFFQKWAVVILLGAIPGLLVGIALYFNSGAPMRPTLENERAEIARQVHTVIDALKGEQVSPEQKIDLLTQYMTLNERRLGVENEIDLLDAERPPLLLFGVLLMAVGSVAATYLAYTLEYRDVTFRNTRQIEQMLELSVLAALPALRGNPSGEKLIQPGSNAAASYESLARRLSEIEGGKLGLLVTSADTDEGKSLTASNLALAFARLGRPTLVIDADLRTPTLHKLFKLSNREGLANLIYAFSPTMPEMLDSLLEAYAKPIEANLTALTTGPLPANPHDLIGLAKFADALHSLRHAFDVVIIDTPSILNTPDALPLLREVDGVLFVVDSRRTHRRQAESALRLIRQSGGRIFGAVLNRSKA